MSLCLSLFHFIFSNFISFRHCLYLSFKLSISFSFSSLTLCLSFFIFLYLNILFLLLFHLLSFFYFIFLYWWLRNQFYRCCKILVLILDGNSETGANVGSNLCCFICVRHLIRSRAVQVGFFSQKNPIILHACTTCSRLPSNISTTCKMEPFLESLPFMK